MTLPVSVVIPSLSSRREFLATRCLPSVLENDPTEVLVYTSEGGGDGNAKRNRGARAAGQPFLLFVDDDCVLRPGCLKRMLTEIDYPSPAVDFVYSDYRKYVETGVDHPTGPGPRYPGPFNVEGLRKANYINTASLMRREAFPGFDETIRRFQDWDLWLTMVARGCVGRYIHECLFELWSVDSGITASIPFEESYEIISRKHNLKRSAD